MSGSAERLHDADALRLPVADVPEGWKRLRPRTLVDMVIDELIAGAARGLVLPGDRIVESDLAEQLGISRVPVREALRILESQGLVVNEPYKGIRLMPVTAERIDQLLEVRVSLETTAATQIVRKGRNTEEGLEPLKRHISELELMAARNDAYGHATADTAFHRAMCRLGGNDVLCNLWEGLSRQMTIFFGLSTFGKSMEAIVDEHYRLIAVLRSGDIAAIGAELDDHINVQAHAVDYIKIIERRKAARDAERKSS